jgi:hypothetical protein
MAASSRPSWMSVTRQTRLVGNKSTLIFVGGGRVGEQRSWGRKKKR